MGCGVSKPAEGQRPNATQRNQGLAPVAAQSAASDHLDSAEPVNHSIPDEKTPQRQQSASPIPEETSQAIQPQDRKQSAQMVSAQSEQTGKQTDVSDNQIISASPGAQVENEPRNLSATEKQSVSEPSLNGPLESRQVYEQDQFSQAAVPITQADQSLPLDRKASVPQYEQPIPSDRRPSTPGSPVQSTSVQQDLSVIERKASTPGEIPSASVPAEQFIQSSSPTLPVSSISNVQYDDPAHAPISSVRSVSSVEPSFERKPSMPSMPAAGQDETSSQQQLFAIERKESVPAVPMTSAEISNLTSERKESVASIPHPALSQQLSSVDRKPSVPSIPSQGAIGPMATMQQQQQSNAARRVQQEKLLMEEEDERSAG